MTTAEESSPSTGPTCPATVTSAPSTGQPSSQWTLWPEDSPANPSPSRGNGSRRPMLDGSGPRSPVAFARYDPASSSWKTCRVCLFEGWETYSETWPRAGTWANGTAYRLPPLVPLTGGTASGLLPTPTEDGNYNRKGASPTSGNGLATVVGGPLNPRFVEWMMGLPDDWTALEDSGTPSSPKSSSGSDGG